jgi:signal peptidase I
MLGFGTVKVSGSSMSPTFMPGDWLLIKEIKGRSHPLKVNSVYLINDPERPGIKLLKRVKEIEVDEVVGEKTQFTYWFEGDHPASTDSRKWGWLNEDQVLGKVLLRYRKGQRLKIN